MLEFSLTLIALNYSGTNHFDSDFWNYCKFAAPNVVNSSKSFVKWKDHFIHGTCLNYGFHSKEIMNSYTKAWNYVV